MRKELLIGCGVSRVKQYYLDGGDQWENLTTLDIDPGMKPDVVWDLEKLPLPFEANRFDEIHAYHCLEHFGTQGDYKFFFAEFEDFWRILKPDGHFIGVQPTWNGEWAWGDPGHRRIITPGTLTFLSQEQYAKQVGKTVMCDYRFCYKADFKRVHVAESPEGLQYVFVLKAIKG